MTDALRFRGVCGEDLGCVSLRKSKIGILIRKRILRFFSKQINPTSVGSGCVKGSDESTLDKDSSVPFMHHDAPFDAPLD